MTLTMMKMEILIKLIHKSIKAQIFVIFRQTHNLIMLQSILALKVKRKELKKSGDNMIGENIKTTLIQS